MLDNDNLTYSYQKRPHQSVSKRTLITQERSQKLDLLVHLLTNLQQSLVVCGPEGIGKTTLLQQLEASCPDSWYFCQLSGSSALSFEGITQKVIQSLELGRAPQLDLNTLRAFCDRQKVILIIDDADQLVPGLTGELIRFAESLHGLRLVFAMSYDAFQIKSNTDEALNDCHLIELPPLNRKQCFDFLQNLSVQPGSQLSLGHLTDSRVDELYRTTDGIPGKLIAEFPNLQRARARRPWGLWLGIIAVLVISTYVAVSIFIEKPSPDKSISSIEQPHLPSQNVAASLAAPTAPIPPTELPAASSNETSQLVNEAISPKPSLDNTPSIAAHSSALPTLTSPTTNIVPVASTQAKPVETPAAAIQNKQLTETQPIKTLENPKPPAEILSKKPAELAPIATQETKPIAAQAEEKTPASPQTDTNADKTRTESVEATSTTGNEDDSHWINDQSGDRYTLQVVTLSSQKAVQRFMIRYPEYADGLKYYIVNTGGQQKFIVIYGSFESATEARQHKEDMPGEFKRALEKRFSSLQKSRS